MRILEQTSSFIKAETNQEQLNYTNLLIKPDIANASMTSFELFDQIVASGREAARKKIPELLQLAKETKQPPKPYPFKACPMESFYVDSIIMRGNNLTTNAFVLGKLRIRADEWVSSDNLDRGLDRLYGSKYYETIGSLNGHLADSGYTLRLKFVKALRYHDWLGLNYK
ncbi:MAG: hypothetical protein U5L96_17945 [Owenweeksia sp.]|nr:hypothetical protein [Owenweeksia sp.]